MSDPDSGRARVLRRICACWCIFAVGIWVNSARASGQICSTVLQMGRPPSAITSHGASPQIAQPLQPGRGRLAVAGPHHQHFLALIIHMEETIAGSRETVHRRPVLIADVPQHLGHLLQRRPCGHRWGYGWQRRFSHVDPLLPCPASTGRVCVVLIMLKRKDRVAFSLFPRLLKVAREESWK